MAITSPDVGSQLVIPSGIIYINPWNSDDEKTGEFDFGESEAFSLNAAGTELARNSRRVKTRPLIKRVNVDNTRTATIQTLSQTINNLQMLFGGSKESIVQTASAVANEERKNIVYDRIYQLGELSANPVGIIGAASISIAGYDSTKAAWASTTAYAVGDNVEKVSDDGTVFRVKTAGTSDGSEPTWVTTTPASVDSSGEPTEGSLTTDGTVVWEYLGDFDDTPYVEDTDYELDATATKGARFRWINTTVNPRYIYANYTPTANSRTRIKTGLSLITTASVRIITDNEGTDKVYYFPKMELQSDGDYELINDGGSFVAASLAAGVLDPGGGLAEIYIDDIPVAA